MSEPGQAPAGDPHAALAPGPLLRIGEGALQVEIAAAAGGRIAQIRFDGVEQLIGPEDHLPDAIAWGCYPMLPWAGRIRHGRFAFAGRDWQLPVNMGAHAIHGVSMWLPWQVASHAARRLELSLELPRDHRWPFGGSARQTLEVDDGTLAMTLELHAGEQAMPATIGWHPWFRKPARVEFHPDAMYPRDAEGIGCLPTVAPVPGPWDDCFLNTRGILVHRGGQRLRLSSDCDHWVVYDETAYSTCIEPQTGPADAFNIAPHVLAPGQALRAWFRMGWR